MDYATLYRCGIEHRRPSMVRVRLICRAYAAGHVMQDIADAFGLSVPRVCKILHGAGMDGHGRRRGPSKGFLTAKRSADVQTAR